jgi:hypothetical protein
MKNEIRKIIEENYKGVEHVGIIEYQPYVNFKEYRIIFKTNNLDINIVINQDIIDLYKKDKEYFITYLLEMINTNIIYYYKKGA